jgi:hypothetical protein
MDVKHFWEFVEDSIVFYVLERGQKKLLSEGTKIMTSHQA